MWWFSLLLLILSGTRFFIVFWSHSHWLYLGFKGLIETIKNSYLSFFITIIILFFSLLIWGLGCFIIELIVLGSICNVLGFLVTKKHIKSEQYNLRGELLNSRGKYYQAIKVLDKAIKSNSENNKPYFSRGFSLESLKDYKNAIRDYTIYIEKYYEDDKAYFHRGFCFEQLKEYKNAVVEYNKAIEINPVDSYRELYILSNNLNSGKDSLYTKIKKQLTE